MNQPTPSPRISRLAWGRVEVEGSGAFKDVKLYPGGCRGWDWKETGTQHAPGIQVADVQELLQHGAQVLVLSRGVRGRLGAAPETLEHLKKQGIAVHHHRTEEAVRVYNDLRATEPAGALIHSTC